MQRRPIQQLLTNLDVFVPIDGQDRLVIDIQGVPYYAGLLNSYTSNSIPTVTYDLNKLKNCRYAIIYHKLSDAVWVIPLDEIPACEHFRVGKQYDEYKLGEEPLKAPTESALPIDVKKVVSDSVTDEELMQMLGKESDTNEHDVQADNEIQPDKETVSE